MPTYLSPGVYVEEVEAGSRPIEGVGTAVAAFVGLAADGPFHTPTLVSNWSEYTKTFGEFAEDCLLPHAVYGYFGNGGGSCYVIRVGGVGKDKSPAAKKPSAAEGPAKADEAKASAAGSGGSGSGRSSPRITAEDFIGDAAARTGLGALEAIEEVTMVACPDLVGAQQRNAMDADAVKAVQLEMIKHCESMGDRMAILDPPAGLSAQQVKEWRSNQAGYDSKYAALYYPWIGVFDPKLGRNRAIPPCGQVAGVWARSDAARGVHKAPANEVVRGVAEPELQLTRSEQELLNPIGVNCIRAFPGRGVRVWGARTISSDPAWRYLNVRRLFNYLEESILNGTQWVVFEPNDEALWARIRRTISAFLVNEWRRGALFGLTPDEAFYVKCDRETNPAESIDAGMVICEIGVAPVKPAEFVVFRLAQVSGGTSVVSE